MNYNHKILIDIPHPHFVHFYHNAINSLGNDNVVVTCQDLPIIRTLLDGYGIKYLIIGKKANSYSNKIFAHIGYGLRYAKLVLRYHIKTVIGTAPSLMFVGLMLCRKRLFFDDDDSAVQGFVLKLNVLLSNYVVTPRCLAFEHYGSKHYTYRGYQELTYLDPGYFIADESVVGQYGLSLRKYAILRLNKFLAYHDIGQGGISNDLVDEIIDVLKKYNLRVLISEEISLSDKYSKYKISIDPKDMHHIMSFAALYIGDSQTMACEAAVLGVPSIRCNTFKDKISYLNELEYKYGLTKSFLPTEGDELLVYLKEVLENEDRAMLWDKRRQRMLEDMEDVNAFIITFIDKKGLR